MDLSRLSRLATHSVSENSTSIISGVAIAGVVVTAALSIRGAVKAAGVLAINAIEDVTPEEDYIPPTLAEMAKETWKFFLPAGIAACCTIACIAGVNHIGLRRQAALVGAYTLVDTAFNSYKEEVIKQIGENKERKVREEVMQKQINENPVVDRQVIITGGGDQLCWESLSGRYFQIDVETIRRAENDYNAELLNHAMYATLNEWYDYLGLEHTELGERLGWNGERRVDLIFSSHLSPDSKPVLAIGYKFAPFAEYGKL